MKKRISEMRAEEKCQAIHDACGLGRQYYIMKRGYYYRLNASGYTDRVAEAGIYTEEEAKTRVYPHGDEPVTMHLVPPQDYLGDLNSMHDAINAYINTEELCEIYADHLRTTVQVNGAVNALFVGYWTKGVKLLNAKASECADAFLLTIGHEQ